MVAALIEARSCERFKLVCDRLDPSSELFAFYNDLFVAEARHFRVFVDLASSISGESLVSARLREIASVEAEIVRSGLSRDERASIHG